MRHLLALFTLLLRVPQPFSLENSRTQSVAPGDGRARSDHRSAAGYTLVELLIVMTLIVILASMAMGQYRTTVIYARESVLKRDLFVMREAVDQYYADKGEYPPTLQALSDDGYIRKVVKDPITDSADTWQIVPEELPPSRGALAGVYDVKSGSDKTALDGSRYADW